MNGFMTNRADNSWSMLRKWEDKKWNEDSLLSLPFVLILIPVITLRDIQGGGFDLAK